MEKQKKRGIMPGLVGLLMFLQLNIFLIQYRYSPAGGGSGAFSFYQPPVLPLTAVSGAEGLEAERKVTWDFAGFAASWDAWMERGQWDLWVDMQDTYKLTNTTQAPLTVKLAYPFIGQPGGPRESLPALTVNGRSIEAMLAMTADRDQALGSASDFDDYAAVISQGNLIAEALSPAPALDIPVRVYHYHHITNHGPENSQSTFLRVQITADAAKTRLLAFNWYSHRAEENRTDLMFRAEKDGTGEGYVLVWGEEIEMPILSGNNTYNITETSGTDAVTCETDVYTATLGEMLAVFSQKAGQYRIWVEEGKTDNGLLPPQVLYKATAKLLASGTTQEINAYSGAFVSLDSIFYNVAWQERVLYWVFPVELAPGETVQIRAAFSKEASTDNGGIFKARAGWDFATGLGSSLTFTALDAELLHWENIQITGQNMGFDLKKGIAEVSLDPQESQYYLSVRRKAE